MRKIEAKTFTIAMISLIVTLVILIGVLITPRDTT